MSEETRRVLDLLAQNKITVDEADQLLHAIGAPPADAGAVKPDEAERPKPKYLRIAVRKVHTGPGVSGGEADSGVDWQRHKVDWQRHKEVNIRVPIALVKSGMRLGALIPGFAGKQVEARLRAQGINVDLSKIDPATIESILNELGGEMNIDIDAGKSQVRITCE